MFALGTSPAQQALMTKALAEEQEEGLLRAEEVIAARNVSNNAKARTPLPYYKLIPHTKYCYLSERVDVSQYQGFYPGDGGG